LRHLATSTRFVRCRRRDPAARRLAGGLSLACLLTVANAFPAAARVSSPDPLVASSDAAILLGSGMVVLLAALAGFALLYRQSRRNLSALRKSNGRLKGYIAATSDYVWQTDEQHRFTYVSPQFTEHTGIAVESVIGRNPIDLLLTELPDVAAQVRDAIARRRPYRDLTYFFHKPDGSPNWLRASGLPQFDEKGRFIGYLGTSRNITDEVEKKQQLADNLALTSYLFDAAPDAIVYCLPDRRIVKINPKFTELFGYAANEAQGRTTEFLYVDRAGWEDSGNRIFDPKADRLFEPLTWLMRRKDGTAFMAEVVGSRVRNAAGAVIGNIGLLRDITDREAANAALREAKEAAEFANRSKSDFLAHMSHELRTPLNAIMGFSEMLELEMHGPLGDRRYRDYIGDIHNSGVLLLSMINDILDLSRIEAGKLELNDGEIAVAALVEESVRFVHGRAATGDVTLRIAEVAPDLTLFADERLVKQMLLNLLSNAIKFTPVGGTVRVITAIDAGGDLRIAVADTGVGIAAADIERVRQPFAQASSVWHKTGEGTGIGLYLVDSLIAAHGGTMLIASEPGNGTIVTLRFPAARVATADAGTGLRVAEQI
jgi:PAS domain S-box-containing protein